MPGTGAIARFKDKVTTSIRGSRSSGRTPASPSGAGYRGAPDPRAKADDPIDVTYAPVHDGDADPGEVAWTWVAYEEDPTQGKDRPVLILGWDGPKLVGVPLSSKDHSERVDADEWLPVGRGAWDPEHRVSYANASRLLRIDPSAVRREGAALEEARFREVIARVRELHGWGG